MADRDAVSATPDRQVGVRRSDWRAVRFLLPTLSIALAGCNGSLSHELSGVWVGKPESAKARNERESKRYAEQLGVEAPPASDDVGVMPMPAAPDLPILSANATTDWEQFNVKVRLHFTGANTIEMSLGEGSQPITGNWRIVENSPGRIVVEIATPGVSAKGDQSEPKEVRRRFEIQPDRANGELVGFTLSEVGADRQLGWLYFTRPSEERGAHVENGSGKRHVVSG